MDGRRLFTVLVVAMVALASVSSVEARCVNRYVVKQGDYLDRIARGSRTTVNTIMANNPQITNRNLIYPGQVLSVPCPDSQAMSRRLGYPGR